MAMKIQAAGIDMSVARSGTGMPLVLVHGFPLDGRMWANQLQAFAGLHDVIVPDLRGAGGSAVTAGEVTMERYADDLAALLDALEVREPIVLCGLSMGGYIALAFWHRHRARLKGLVLTDTRATADAPEAAAGRRATADKVEREGSAELVEQMLPKLLSTTTQAKHPDVVDEVRSMMLAQPAEGVAAAARGLARRNDWTHELKNIELPTLVMVGAEDAITTPADMQGMASAIAGSTYVELPGAGHLPPMETPQAFDAELTKFLRRFE